MTVTVVYTTQLKAALGTGSEQLQLDCPVQLGDVLQSLRNRHGEVFADLVFDADDQLLPSILLCIGDDQVDPKTDPLLKDGDTVTILSAISGG